MAQHHLHRECVLLGGLFDNFRGFHSKTRPTVSSLVPCPLSLIQSRLSFSVVWKTGTFRISPPEDPSYHFSLILATSPPLPEVHFHS